jgi:hypothetical protein
MTLQSDEPGRQASHAAKPSGAPSGRCGSATPWRPLEIDLSGIMRGDYPARWTAIVAVVGAGILPPDEVREQEGFNPLPPGAKPAMPATGVAAAALADPAMVDCADPAC